MAKPTSAAVILAFCALPSLARAGQIEAYPIPTSAEISIGLDSKGAKARPIPAPSEKALLVVAPRNGVANAQILLRAQGGPAAAAVAVSDLQGPGGASIAAGKVQVRYGQYITGEKNLCVYRWQKDIGLSPEAGDDKAAGYGISQGIWRIDALLPTGRCEVEENLPRCAWLTFTVERDVAPGLYKGAAKVDGVEAAIPVELEVVDAVVPGLAESAMTNDIRPMWEVIALGNGVGLDECWRSDKFWKVTGAYLARLGALRMSSCGIGVVAPATTSSLGMVKWTRKGDKWSWDYAVMDKFIETGRQALLQLADDEAAAELAAAFVKDLTAHLAALKLDKKLALGIWHDKMSHTGGKIRQRLLKDMPDLKLSLWAHSDGWAFANPAVKDRVGSYMSKCPIENPGSGMVSPDKVFPYPIKIGMRRAFEKPIAFGPYAWDAAVRNRAGLGQVDFANWGGDRRAKEYTYFGAGMFTSWQRQLVYPMYEDQVVTGVLYELFREYAQDFELIKLMQAKGVKTGFLESPRRELDTISELDRVGRLFARPDAEPAKVDRMHWDILRQAGQAKVRPEGK
jgi:hypothetical protein